MDLEDFTALCMYLYVMVRKWLAVHWLRICCWTIQPKRYIKPASEYRHKVLIIGDGFAEGFGDSVHFAHSGGVSHYLRSFIAKDEKLRHNWQILNCGVTDSTSDQWTGNSETKYFKKLIAQRAYNDADVICVMLGSMDESNGLDAKETLKNIKMICDSIRKKGKRVCVAPVSIVGANEEAQEDQRKRNKLIQEFCSSTKYDDIPIQFGPQLNAPQFRKPDSRAFDGIHLNGRAYKILARSTFDMLQPILLNVEWSVWKEKLSSIEYHHGLYE